MAKKKKTKVFDVVAFRNILKTTGIRQTFIADKVGVSNITIGSWKAGRGEPTIVHLNHLAKALGIEVKALMRK